MDNILCIMIFFVTLVQTFMLLLTKYPITVGYGDEYFSTLSHEVASSPQKDVFHALSLLSRGMIG